MNLKTMLVTGGAGFIGSNFVRHILRRRPEVRVINYDNLSYAGSEHNLHEIADESRHVFIKGDIADPLVVAHVFTTYQPEVVINFAAATHVDRSIHEGLGEFIRTNVSGTATLLEAAKRAGIKKFIQISTDEVYGALPLDSERKFTETDRLEPNNPYAATKAAAEKICRAYWRTWGVPIVITRAGNNFGPYQYPEKFIPFALRRLLTGKKLPVYGDGRHVRDWLYVADHCQAVEACLEAGEPGEIYNVGGENEKNNLELARAIVQFLGHNENMIEFVADRPGHDARYALDCGKAGRQLGWRPVHRFDDVFPATLEWYLKNQEWMSAVTRSSQLNAHLS